MRVASPGIDRMFVMEPVMVQDATDQAGWDAEVNSSFLGGDDKGSPWSSTSQSPLQEQRIRIRVSHVPFDKPSPGWSWPIGDPSRSMIDRCSVVRECVRVDFFPIFQEGRWAGWRVCMIFGDVCVQTSPVHHRGMARECKMYLVPSVPNKGSMSWAASGATASLRIRSNDVSIMTRVRMKPSCLSV
jgi:hypothetical protein